MSPAGTSEKAPPVFSYTLATRLLQKGGPVSRMSRSPSLS